MKNTLDESASLPTTISEITAMELRSRHGAILQQVREGTYFIVRRRGRPIAMLSPYEEVSSVKGRVSGDQLRKLNLVDELSADELEKLISLIRGDLNLLEILKKSRI